LKLRTLIIASRVSYDSMEFNNFVTPFGFINLNINK